MSESEAGSWQCIQTLCSEHLEDVPSMLNIELKLKLSTHFTMDTWRGSRNCTSTFRVSRQFPKFSSVYSAKRIHSCLHFLFNTQDTLRQMDDQRKDFVISKITFLELLLLQHVTCHVKFSNNTQTQRNPYYSIQRNGAFNFCLINFQETVIEWGRKSANNSVQWEG